MCGSGRLAAVQLVLRVIESVCLLPIADIGDPKMNGWNALGSGHSSWLNDLTSVLRRSVEIATDSGHSSTVKTAV